MGSPDEGLFELCKKGDCEAVERAIGRDPKAVNDYNDDGLTPIHIAAQGKNLNLIRRLLPLGADPSARCTQAASSMRGYTAMHLAAKAGDIDTMQFLFDAGGSVKQQGSDGWTPLHCAAFSGKVDAIRWLLDRKADPNVLNEHSISPLAFCANHGRLEGVRMLIKAGSNMDSTDANGDTVFHHAMHVQMFKLFEEDYKFPEAQIDIACVLAICGADLDVKNKSGWLPTHWVEEAFGGLEFARVLRLLGMNSVYLQGAEGNLTTNWNFMTLLSIKNRKVYENIGVDPQQAKDLVDSLHAFETERMKKKKDDENNPQGPCPFIPANKRKKNKKNMTPLEIEGNDDPEQGSETHPTHDREEAERLKAEGKDPSGGACPFFTGPAEPEQGMDQQAAAASPAEDAPPAPPEAPPAPPSPPAGAAAQPPAAPTAAYPPAAAPPPGWPAAPPTAAYPPPPYAWSAPPPPAGGTAAAADAAPDLNWQWVYENRTALLCCVISFLLGMWWERRMA